MSEPPSRERRTLRIGHSPDPDDAFMWYPLAETDPDGVRRGPRVDCRGYRFEHVLEDIEALNQRSEQGELEITALSIHQYPYVADRYALTSCGASMGEGYGPMVVARGTQSLEQAVTGAREGLRLAIPGRRTTAWLALQLLLREQGVNPEKIQAEVAPFDMILPHVASGDYDAGLIIHEGQLTYQDAGLACVEDLGAWWKRTRGLPLPLGGNAIRRDLGEAMPIVCRVLSESIHWALENRDDAVSFALQYARGMGRDLADRFVQMYVNERTLDYGEKGLEAVRRLLSEGAAAGLVPDCGTVEPVRPEGEAPQAAARAEHCP